MVSFMQRNHNQQLYWSSPHSASRTHKHFYLPAGTCRWSIMLDYCTFGAIPCTSIISLAQLLQQETEIVRKSILSTTDPHVRRKKNTQIWSKRTYFVTNPGFERGTAIGDFPWLAECKDLDIWSMETASFTKSNSSSTCTSQYFIWWTLETLWAFWQVHKCTCMIHSAH